MTPVLLDQNSLFRAGVSIILVMTVVFIGGYSIGYRSAESGEGVNLNKTMVLALPRQAHAEVSAFEPLIPETQVPGADIDVDSPETAADATDVRERSDMPLNQTDSGVAAVIEQTTNAIEAPVDVEKPGVRNVRPVQLAALRTATAEREADGAFSAVEQAKNHPHAQDRHQPPAAAIESARQAVVTDSARVDDARYTIQVGVFADAGNAMRRKTQLEAQQLTAYVNEYKNKRDQTRYNVRFGYFNDKSSALAALAHFEQHLSGSGYVTRIRGHQAAARFEPRD